MNKFKPGDIIVIINHKGVHEFWFDFIPIGLVTYVIPGLLMAKEDEVSIKLLNGDGVRTNVRVLRLATEREQFLCHILGPYILEE